jgi:hypothetical protein
MIDFVPRADLGGHVMRAILAVSAALATVLLLAPSASAVTGGRTFVSVDGSDSNPCTRALPCRTFGVAISVANPQAEVVALDSGGYGPVNITKATTLLAPRGVHAAIAPDTGDAIDINAGPNDKVVIKNLYLNGQGATNGIVANSARTVEVDDTTAAGFTNIGTFLGTGVANGPRDVSLSDSVTRDNGSGPVLVGSNGVPMAVEVDHVRVARNADGILAVNDVRGTVTDSITSRNGFSGVRAFAGSASDPVSLGLERVTTTGNNRGLADAPRDVANVVS